VPALEVLLNTALVAELIEKATSPPSRRPWRSRWPKARRPSRKTLPASIIDERVSREEGLAQADSPTNLMWRLQNRAAPKQQVDDRALTDQVDEPTFTDITLDVKF
jgi:twitching motility protein PilU